jgi:formylglycine-generating enzyme required for sulfatase activity
MRHFIIIAFFILVSSGFIFSNGLQVNITGVTTSTVTFDISWDNSWNIQNRSRDAVWIFVKYQDCQSNEKTWNHLNLSSTSSSHSIAGSLLQVDAVTDGKGVFIRRSSFSGGNNPVTSATVAFANAFSSVDDINIVVLGIEMVYVPQGSFIAGDGLSTKTFGKNAINEPHEITSEAGIAANGLAFSTDLNWANGNAHPAIIAEFPKGFNAFYCMKYEITQNQYVQFLNLLTATHQAARTAQAPGLPAKTPAMFATTGQYRNYIQIKTPASGNPLSPAVYGMNADNDNNFDEPEDGGNVACNFLSWNDLLAYLDWSALRPMTELEYEKACRGPASAGPFMSQMYAWGNTNLTMARARVGEMFNPQLPNETSTSVGDGLCSYNRDNPDTGPFRVGFAAGAGTSRSQAGATYYGIMEMSGNVGEQCYHIGRVHNDNSRPPTTITAQFQGVLGDGELNNDGESNQNSWGLPIEHRESIVRGGGMLSGSAQLRVSDRYYLWARSDEAGNNNRQRWLGGRGVRQF